MHDCEKEYWRHCLRCVSGDPGVEVEETVLDDTGMEVEAVLVYPDGDRVRLIHGVNGWRFP